MQIDKADWIIVENTHEPIIDQYTFDRVQELMKLRTKSTLKTGNVHLFSGLLRCADCKRAMERVTVKRTTVRFMSIIAVTPTSLIPMTPAPSTPLRSMK